MSRSRFERLAFAYAAGIVTGAVLALLYTPITGKKMQKKVANTAGKVMDTVDDLQQSVRKIAHA